MLEDVFIQFVADFVEVVHVELTHKGGEVAMPEVSRQNLLLESLHVQNSEVCSLFVPSHNARVFVALGKIKVYLENFKGFGDEDRWT
jgi:hypothetical protein